MLYCPKCGTANRRGSRFCNECGEMLPMHTGLRCPMCGAMNPVQNAYCDQCNARIVPLTVPGAEEMKDESSPIRGLSLPTIPHGETPAAAEPQEVKAEEAEDWLARSQDSGEGEAEPQAPQEEEGAQDWLTRLRVPTAGTAEESKVEDWLAQLRGSTAEEIPTPEPEAEFAEPSEPVEIPDWLRGMEPMVSAEQPSTAAPEQPQELAPIEPAPETIPAEPEPEEAAFETPTLAPAEVPEWLQELAPAEPAPEKAAAEPEEAASEIPTLAPAEVPEWLQELAPAEPAPEKAAAEPEKAPLEMPTLAPAEVPEWLQELASTEPAPEAVPAEPEPEEMAFEMPTPVPAEIPEWLQELAPAQPVSEETIPAMPTPVPGEIPEWLQGLAPAEPIPSAAEQIPAEPAPEETVPAMSAPVPGEIPEWLQDLAPAEPIPSAAEQIPVEPVSEETVPAMIAPVPGEIPEWLREAAPPSPPPFVSEPVLVEAETPDWLAEPKERAAPPTPEGAPPPFAIEPDTAAAEAAGLARAEIPAWLEAMRPSVGVAGAAIEEEPAESGGLLEGLRGVLSPLSIAEAAHAREGISPAGASEAALARAQLLQSLLTRPAEAPQPELRKRAAGVSELIPRLLIAAVLFTVVAGILLPQYVDGLPYQVPTLTQPNPSSVDGAYNLIEGISENESVLIAFEYGGAQADELNAVAEPILKHLMEQKAVISAASTQPEGLAVAEALRIHINAEGQQALEYSAPPIYQPGNATGVARILARAETRPTLIIVLAAQPDPLRWWIEQAQAHYRGASPPIVAGVSAALEAATSPYFDANAGQLKGLVSGLSGAAAYETHRGATGKATQQLNALAAGHFAIVGLMLVGAAVYAFGGSRRRGQ
jgi:hypothetical protein